MERLEVIIADLIDEHYKAFVKNIQLSTEAYFSDRDRLVGSILLGTWESKEFEEAASEWAREQGWTEPR